LKPSEHKDSFGLENLEQRVMLSADPLLGTAVTGAPDRLENPLDTLPKAFPAEEILLYESDPSNEDHSFESLTYDPSEQLEDIFSGLPEQNLFAEDESEEILPNVTPAQDVFDAQDKSELPAEDDRQHDVTVPDHHPWSDTEESGAASLTGPYEVLDTRLQTSVFDYSGDARAPPGECRVETSTSSSSAEPGGDVYPDSGTILEIFNLRPIRDGEVCLEIRADGADGQPIVLVGRTIAIGEVRAPLPESDSLSIHAGAITVAGEIDYTGNVEFDAGKLDIHAPMTAANIFLAADTIKITSEIQSRDGGTLVLQPRDDTASIGIADGTAGQFHLSTAELDLIDGNFQRILIGREQGSHLFTIGSYTFHTSVTFRAPFSGGEFNVYGLVRTDSTDGDEASLTFHGPGHTITQHTDTVTTGVEIFLDDSVIAAEDAAGAMGDGAVYYDTTGGGASTSGADIIITGNVDGQILPNSAYNDMDVFVVADLASGDPVYAEFSSTLNRLTIHVDPGGTSTTAGVAAAINNVYNFYDALSDDTGSDGYGIVNSASTNPGVTSNGSTTSLAVGAFTLAGDTITFEAGNPTTAEAFNGAGVFITADSGSAAGSAEYSIGDNLLTVHIQSGVTTTSQVAAAINDVFNFFDVAGGDSDAITLRKSYPFVTV